MATVGSAQIDDEAVTLAKLAHAGAYELLMRNAGTTGDPAYAKISALTEEASPASGDWLLGEESGGALRKFDFGNFGGGVWEKIGSDVTASNDATITVTGLSAASYLEYKFVWTDIVPSTDNVIFRLRTSSDGGSSYDSGTNDYGFMYFNINNTSVITTSDGGENSIEIFNNSTGDNFGSAAGEGGNLIIEACNPDSDNGPTAFRFYGAGENRSGQTLGFEGFGVRHATTDVNAVQFSFSSGNIESGTLRVYGLKVS